MCFQQKKIYSNLTKTKITFKNHTAFANFEIVHVERTLGKFFKAKYLPLGHTENLSLFI